MRVHRSPVLISDAAHNRGRKHSASHAHAVAVSDVLENNDTPYHTPRNTLSERQRHIQGTSHQDTQKAKHACKLHQLTHKLRREYGACVYGVSVGPG